MGSVRNEIINKINDLFDENVDLKIRNSFLESKEEQRNEAVNEADSRKTNIDKKIIEYGKKILTKEVLSTWSNEVRVYRDDESKEINTTSFDKWFDNKIKSSDIPNNMSRAEVKELIYPYAVEQYEKEKAESMKKFEEKESEEK